MPAFYELEEDDIYTEQANAIDPTRKELDEKLEGLLFIVSRTPFVFPALPSNDVRRAVYDGTPRLRVWFRVINGTDIIRLLSIERYGLDQA